MQVPKDFPKIELASSKEESRYAIVNPWLSVADDGTAKLTATDGRICAVIPVEVDGDKPSFVPIAALVAARKAATMHAPARLTLNGSAEVRNGPTFPLPEDANTPDVDAVIPKRDSDDGFLCIHLSAEALHRLAQAIGAPNGPHRVGGMVRLQFGKTEDGEIDGAKPIRVDTMSGEGFGAIMPIGEPK